MSGSDALDFSLEGLPDKDRLRAPRLQWFFTRLDPEVAGSFTEAQNAAIAKVLDDGRWSEPPVNIRFSFRLFRQRYYVTIIGGGERRGDERRAADRKRYPLRTLGNAFFALGVLTLMYAAGLILLAFHAAIIE